MKKAFRALAFVAVLGCITLVSTSFVDAPVVKQKGKKVAIVTFYADKYIDVSMINSTAGLVTSVSTMGDDPNFDLKPALESFHKAFFDIVAKNLPFELLDEKDVIGDEQYKAYESRWGETADKDRSKLMKRFIAVDGYKPMSEFLGKKGRNELKMLEMFKGKVDGVMFVRLDFAFNPQVAVGGMGTAKIRAFCRMKLWNKEGKKVFALNEYANSKKSIGLVAGVPVMKAKKIVPLCTEATERLIADVLKKIPKKVSKVVKKL